MKKTTKSTERGTKKQISKKSQSLIEIEEKKKEFRDKILPQDDQYKIFDSSCTSVTEKNNENSNNLIGVSHSVFGDVIAQDVIKENDFLGNICVYHVEGDYTDEKKLEEEKKRIRKLISELQDNCMLLEKKLSIKDYSVRKYFLKEINTEEEWKKEKEEEKEEEEEDDFHFFKRMNTFPEDIMNDKGDNFFVGLKKLNCFFGIYQYLTKQTTKFAIVIRNYSNNKKLYELINNGQTSIKSLYYNNIYKNCLEENKYISAFMAFKLSKYLNLNLTKFKDNANTFQKGENFKRELLQLNEYSENFYYNCLNEQEDLQGNSMNNNRFYYHCRCFNTLKFDSKILLCLGCENGFKMISDFSEKQKISWNHEKTGNLFPMGINKIKKQRTQVSTLEKSKVYDPKTTKLFWGSFFRNYRATPGRYCEFSTIGSWYTEIEKSFGYVTKDKNIIDFIPIAVYISTPSIENPNLRLAEFTEWTIDLKLDDFSLFNESKKIEELYSKQKQNEFIFIPQKHVFFESGSMFKQFIKLKDQNIHLKNKNKNIFFCDILISEHLNNLGFIMDRKNFMLLIDLIKSSTENITLVQQYE